MNDFHGGLKGKLNPQAFHKRIILFHANQPADLAGKVVGERTLPRSDLQHLVFGPGAQAFDDATLQVGIDQKVLAERALGTVWWVGARQMRTSTAVRSSGCGAPATSPIWKSRSSSSGVGKSR